MASRIPSRFGISWREGEPETAIKWRGAFGKVLAEVRFFRLDPRKLRRIRSSWWWYPCMDGTSVVEIARWCEDRVRQVPA